MKHHRALCLALALCLGFWGERSAAATDSSKPAEPLLPWEREMPLKEAARTTALTSSLDPDAPTVGANVSRFTLSNMQVRSSLWGPSNRPTLSILKTDVWDRRIKMPEVVTLAQIRAGVYSPANTGFDDMPPHQRRPVRGWLPPDGSGRVDPYATWNAYPFPCQKPVGQIILGLDELAGIDSPALAQSCADGVIRFRLRNDKAQADLQVLLSMTRNVYAIRGKLTGVGTPWLRLYRHEDQAWRRYLNEDKKTFRVRTPGAASGAIRQGPPWGATQIPFDYARDAAWNGPMEPPSSGSDGKYFWIRQRFPAEKTFPNGFDYVLMGVVVGQTKIETVDGKTGLGTPPTGVRGEARSRLEDCYRFIRAAPGSAATATLPADNDSDVTAYVTVVTCNDAPDPMAEARRLLDAALADGFDKMVAENTAWYDKLYEQREHGRVFYGDTGAAATEDIQEVFTSWNIRHGGSNQPDMRRYEATASYSNLEQDWQLWHSLPCYNEVFYTGNFVRNRADAAAMWWKIFEAWTPAARKNAREVYGVPAGMALVHGYIPPLKPDVYIHTNLALEFCIDTMAQTIKPVWEQWDYGGDEQFLRQHTYPALREAAVFYANYATKGEDGRYHFIPSMEAEGWGIFPQFRRARDSISSLCMARWTFQRAAEAARLLNMDADWRTRWLEVESKLAPYPTYDTPQGPIFNAVLDTVPNHNSGDHGFYIGLYPTSMADEINLDSSRELKEMMARTARTVSTSHSTEACMLLGLTGQGSTDGRDTATRSSRGGSGPSGGRGRSSVPEASLNSRSGRIHLFPTAPTGEVVAFRDFQARDAFLVSAVRSTRGVTYVEIQARRDLRCQVMNPWPGSAIVVRLKSGGQAPFTLDRRNGECLVFTAHRGQSYIIEKKG